MSITTYPDSETIQKLHTIRQLEPWRANALGIALGGLLRISRLPIPETAQTAVASVFAKVVLRVAPLLTNEVVEAWKAGRYLAVVLEAARALRQRIQE